MATYKGSPEELVSTVGYFLKHLASIAYVISRVPKDMDEKLG